MKTNCGKALKRIVGVSVLFVMVTTPVLAATVTTNSWNLVDSGKHLDWDGNSNYLVYFTDAIATWNSYKAGVIRRDTWSVVEDVSISDYYGDTETVVKVSADGKIKFNQRVMDTISDSKKENACAMALGLALGLGETTNKSDIMYKYNTSNTSLSVNDKASYDSVYKTY